MNCLGCFDVLVDGRCPRCEPPGELVLEPPLPPASGLGSASAAPPLELDVVRPEPRRTSVRPSARPLSHVVAERLAARETDGHESTIDPRVRGQFGMTVPFDSRAVNTWSLPVLFAFAALPVLVGEGPLVHMTVGCGRTSSATPSPRGSAACSRSRCRS